MPDVLERLSPVMVFAVADEPMERQVPGKAFVSRVTRWHELEIITGGTGSMTVNGLARQVRSGDLYYRPPGTSVTGMMPYGYILVVFDPVFSDVRSGFYQEGRAGLGDAPAGNIPSVHPPLPLPPVSGALEADEILPLMRRMFQAFIRGTPGLGQKISLLTLIDRLVESGEAGGPTGNGGIPGPVHPRVLECQRLIDKAPEAPWGLAELAARMQLSPGFLSGLFSKTTGTTLTAYIHEARVRMARNLLVESNRPAEDIARACGFDNMSFFYRVFRRHTGMTPAAYRQYYRL